ncbi:MAG TPA: hypothetical protein PK685_03570 [archaeon]|nr:hypothetical protein [archaeon]
MTLPYLFSLVITIVLEFTTHLFFIKRPILDIVFYAILINCVTHPIATIFYKQTGNLIIIEFSVFIVEIFLIKWLFEIDYKKAILISAIANLLTAILGKIISII